MPHEPTGERATAREWAGLALLVLPMLTLTSDLSVLFFALPTLSADLDPSASQALWIVHVYGFLVAGFLVTMGRLGDRVGPRRLLLIGASAFAAVSAVAAFSTEAWMLIAARALLGVAGATLMPSLYSLLRIMFRDETSGGRPSRSSSAPSRPAARSARCWAGRCWSSSGGARSS